MAADCGLGLKNCEEIYCGLMKRYDEESLALKKIGRQLFEIHENDGIFRSLQIEDLTFDEPEKMGLEEREQKKKCLMEVVEKVKELEDRAFLLLEDLLLGAETLDGERSFCRARQELELLEAWGHELIDEEECMERYIDELDRKKAFFLQSIHSLGIEISLEARDCHKRWWHNEVEMNDSPREILSKETMLGKLSREFQFMASRSLASSTDGKRKKKSPREYLEKIPIHFSDDAVSSFQTLRRKNKRLKNLKKRHVEES